jgi:ATP-dependent exoDNAse (exonuclease V) beta subunit
VVNSLDDNELKLNEKKHVYTRGRKKYKAVTDFVNSFFPPFNEEEVAEKVAEKKGLKKKDVLAEWKALREEGTKVHKEVEAIFTTRAKPTHPKALQADKYFLLELFENYFENGSDFYPEVKIYSDYLELAGTIDLLIITPNKYMKSRVILIDWKTNKEIRSQNQYEMTEEPVAHLHNSSLNKYALQLSTYAYILEKDYDMVIDALYIVHLKEDSYKVIPVDYLKETVKNMVWRG